MTLAAFFFSPAEEILQLSYSPEPWTCNSNLLYAHMLYLNTPWARSGRACCFRCCWWPKARLEAENRVHSSLLVRLLSTSAFLTIDCLNVGGVWYV